MAAYDYVKAEEEKDLRVLKARIELLLAESNAHLSSAGYGGVWLRFGDQEVQL